MQIACPACKTRISVPDDKIKPQGTKVKCGKCSKIFTVKKKGADTPAPAPAPAAAPAPAPATQESQAELDKLFGEEPPAAVADSKPSFNVEDELGLGRSSAPVSDDVSYLGGDNFGAEMDNYKTQLRPMAGGRESGLFGESSDLDAPAKPQRQTSKDDLFGSSDDLFSEEPAAPAPKAAPVKAKSAAPNPVDDLFQEESPRSKPASVMPSKENLDDLFGKGLDDDAADDLVNKLREAKPAKQRTSDVDDLFGPRDEKPERKAAPAPSKLDSLFSDEESPAPTPPKRAEAAPPPPPQPAGPTAEELAATMKLEPALKEEDLPKPPPVKAAEPKAPAKAKRSFPVKAVVLSVVVLALGGAGAAAVFVPAVNKPVIAALNKLPIEKVTALFETKAEAPKVEPVLVSAAVQRGRELIGGRGDKLYVVEGTVTNNYPGSRSFIKVRGTLLGSDGAELAVREVFAGNTLNDEEIRGLERVKIDGILNRSVGGGLQNFNVPPGQTIPFQIVFYDVEQPVQSQNVVPIGSEPGN